MMLEKIEKLTQEIKSLHAKNAEELEALRIKYLSRKGELQALMADFKNVAAEDKKTVGMRVNELKQLAFDTINGLRSQLANGEEGDACELDLTRTAYPIELGTRHPLSIVKNEIVEIFQRMGFTLADGPEVEDDLHIFTKMNFAADPPAFSHLFCTGTSNGHSIKDGRRRSSYSCYLSWPSIS